MACAGDDGAHPLQFAEYGVQHPRVRSLVRVWNGDREGLRYLDRCGIRLGERIEVLGREPLGAHTSSGPGEPKVGRVHSIISGLAELLSIDRVDVSGRPLGTVATPCWETQAGCWVGRQLGSAVVLVAATKTVAAA
jgi:hypothetical protein